MKSSFVCSAPGWTNGPGHNGTGGTHYRLNWDTCKMTSMLAIGVFLDDETTFNEALDFFAMALATVASSGQSAT